MKVKEDFLLRCVAGKYIVVPVGDEAVDFNGLITTNETGAFLWENMKQDVTKEKLIELMLAEYDIDVDTAEADISAFIKKLEDAGLTE